MMRFFCATAAVLTLLVGAEAARGQVVGIVQSGCGIVIMQDGELFATPTGPTCGAEQGPWTSVGNVFALAGRVPSQVAGASMHGQLVAANGDWFQLGPCGGGAPFQGNVFELAGVSPKAGEKFVAFGAGQDYIEYAITNFGAVYRWQGGGCTAGWMQIQSLPIAPTVVRQESWGILKAKYR